MNDPLDVRESPDAKPHISPSQMETYARCPEAWRRRYVCGDISPPGIAAVTGKGVHGGAQINFSQKIDTHIDLPTEDIADAAVAVFEAELSFGEVEIRAFRPGRIIAEAKDRTAEYARLHAELQAPDYQPLYVEHAQRVVLPNCTHDLLGVIDLADILDRVIDWKVASKRMNEQAVASSVALTYYAVAHEYHTGRPSTEVRLDTIVKNKTPVRHTLAAKRGPRDFTALAHRVDAQLAAIKAGSFPPASVGAWWCSPRFCGYHSTCPYVNSQPVIVDLNPSPPAAEPTRFATPPGAIVIPPEESSYGEEYQLADD